MSFNRVKRDAKTKTSDPLLKSKGSRKGFSNWLKEIPQYIPKTLVGNDKLYVVMTSRGVETFISEKSVPEDKRLPMEDFLSIDRVPGVLRQVYREKEKLLSSKKRTLYAMRLEKRVMGKEVETAVIHPDYDNIMAQGRVFAINLRSSLGKWEMIKAREVPSNELNAMVELAFRDAASYVRQMGVEAGKNGGRDVQTLKQFGANSKALSSLMGKVLNDTLDPSRTAMQQFNPRDKTKALSIRLEEIPKIACIQKFLQPSFVELNKWLTSKNMVGYFMSLEKGETARQRIQESYLSTRISLQWKETAEEFLDTKKLNVPSVGSCLGISAFVRGMNALLYQIRAARIPMGADLHRVVPLFAEGVIYNENTTTSAKTQIIDAVKDGRPLTCQNVKAGEFGLYLEKRIALGGLNQMYPYIGAFEAKMGDSLFDEAKLDEKDKSPPPPPSGVKEAKAFVEQVLTDQVISSKSFLAFYETSFLNGTLENDFRHFCGKRNRNKDDKKKDKKSLRQTTRQPMSRATVDFLMRIKKKKGEEERVLYPAREAIGELLSTVSSDHFQARMVGAFRALAQRSLIYHDGDLGAVLNEKISIVEDDEKKDESEEDEVSSDSEDLDA